MPDAPQVIACPTCAKKFKLPERPPATFTCTGCQTVMDLSAFRAPAAAAVPVAAPPPPEAPAAGEPEAEATGGRREGRGGGRPPHGPRGRAGARAGRGGAHGRAALRSRHHAAEEEGDEEGEGRFAPPKKNNNALIFGSLGGLVVIVVVAFLALGGKGGDSDKSPEDAAKADAAMKDAAMGAAMGPPMPNPTPDETAMADPTPKPASSRYVAYGRRTLHEVGHHPDATPEEQQKIDSLIQQAVFQNLGMDSKRAGKELVETYKVKAAPRLINVFFTVKSGEGFDRDGLTKCAVADNYLRQIDGWIERHYGARNMPITAASDPKIAENKMKMWYAWWDEGKYKEPLKPWDERVDGRRDEATGGEDAAAPMGG